MTLGQWKAVMAGSPNDCDYGCEDNHPVTNVSWNDACHFMVELTLRENEVLRVRGEPELTPCYEWTGETCVWKDPACTGFRLPTETEWEYFARAGTTTAYSFGDDPKDMCKHGNGGDLAAKRKHPELDKPDEYGQMLDCDDGYPDLAPVGSFAENPWGLHDVHGNAWEWTWDWYAAELDPRASALGYVGPDAGDMRVLRGGSFRFRPGRLRAANRDRVRPTVQSPFIGFRCVRGAPQHSTD